MNDIGKIDKNLLIKETIDKPDVKFYDVREEPFEIYGLYEPKTEPVFIRMPADVAVSVGSLERQHNVSVLAYHTAGARVRFSTDSSYIAIRCHMDKVTPFSHMTLVGSAGFDLYMDDEGEGVFCGIYEPPYGMTNGYESIREFKFTERKMRSYTIHFPLYNMVNDLYIGVEGNARIGAGKPYKYKTPVVIYGSSITQGCSASHPGNCYSNMISRMCDCDHINLGFSGSAKGEDEMIEYLASLDMSAFVCDYDLNAPNAAHLAATHSKVYRGVRDAHPNIPILFVSRPCFDRPTSGVRWPTEGREIVFKTYSEAYNSGDTNVFFIDGESVFGTAHRDACTIDLYHPTDLGHARMADAIGYRIGKLLQGARYGGTYE